MGWFCPAVLVVSLLAFPPVCGLVYRYRHSGRLWWFLNRLRAISAFEPDPGRWPGTKRDAAGS